MKVKVKLTFRSNDKTINTIATNSKEMGQLITESLRKEKQALSDNKKIQKSEKKNLTLKHSGETLSIQEGKCRGNTTKLKEEHTKCFPACCQWILNECPEIIYKVLSRMKMRRNLK